MLISRIHSKIAPGSIPRCTSLSHMCYTGGPVTIRPFTHHIFRSAIILQVMDPYYTLDSGTLYYPALQDLINIKEDQDNIFVWKIPEKKHENESFITFPKDFLSSDSFNILDTIRKLKSCTNVVNNPTSAPITIPQWKIVKKHSLNEWMFLTYSQWITIIKGIIKTTR